MAATKDLGDRENVLLSSDALDLLDCFEGDFGEIVQEMAEHFARIRMIETQGDASYVEVTAKDVRQAGASVIDALSKMAAAGKMSREVVEKVEQMSECFSCKEH
ncbi:MAG: hypothetical protein Q8K78_11780 [Planctomycetaceae bacterium]|nr:hypothetical protein [Planctomycetaceae bacterium]